MKRKVILSFILWICMVGMACRKSFLETSIPNNVARQLYVKDLSTLEEFMNGIYMLLSRNTASGYTKVYPELIADNIRPVSGQTTLAFFYRWEQQEGDRQEVNVGVDSENMNAFSTGNYAVISSCNFVVEKAAQFKVENPEKAGFLLGQALTLRALCHFNLVNVFAQSYNYTTDASHPGVVYNRTYEWANPVKGRHTVKEVYGFMVDDLQQAISVLPNTTTSTLLVNKLFAQALLSRLYLYMEQYVLAKNMGIEIIKQKPLMTITAGYPDDMFKLLAYEKTECFFQLLPAASVSMGYKGGGLFPGHFFRTTKTLLATSDAAAMYAESATDVRKKWITTEGVNKVITKFPTGVISDVAQTGSSYISNVIRSSELYLNISECYMKLNRQDSACFYLDIIRKRADPNAVSTVATGADLQETIFKERRKELAFEGYRMMDLLRWKRGVLRADANTTDVKTLSYPSNKAIAPIPLIDIKVSGLQQNEGY